MKANSSFSGRTCNRGKTVRRLGSLLLGLLILVYLCVVLLSQFYGWRFDAVTTGSMEPTYKIGGVVVVRPVDPANIGVGDIITYEVAKTPEVLVTHRIVGVVEDSSLFGFRTKGDANSFLDTKVVLPEDIRGRVELYIPLFGHFVTFVKTPHGFALFLAIPGVVIVWREFRRMLSLD